MGLFSPSDIVGGTPISLIYKVGTYAAPPLGFLTGPVDWIIDRKRHGTTVEIHRIVTQVVEHPAQ